ncbi:hypothetical protein BGZ98_000839 [Dissophora globulifera]|nr:hypothetical protein BGZ98_000839 [Dissophora globulifera]
MPSYEDQLAYAYTGAQVLEESPFDPTGLSAGRRAIQEEQDMVLRDHHQSSMFPINNHYRLGIHKAKPRACKDTLEELSLEFQMMTVIALGPPDRVCSVRAL